MPRWTVPWNRDLNNPFLHLSSSCQGILSQLQEKKLRQVSSATSERGQPHEVGWNLLVHSNNFRFRDISDPGLNELASHFIFIVKNCTAYSTSETEPVLLPELTQRRGDRLQRKSVKKQVNIQEASS